MRRPLCYRNTGFPNSTNGPIHRNHPNRHSLHHQTRADLRHDQFLLPPPVLVPQYLCISSTPQSGLLPVGGFQSLESIIPHATATSPGITCPPTLGSIAIIRRITTMFPSHPQATPLSKVVFQSKGSSTPPVFTTAAPGSVIPPKPNAGITVVLQGATQQLSSLIALNLR
jgi:hypothetical protein